MERLSKDLVYCIVKYLSDDDVRWIGALGLCNKSLYAMLLSSSCDERVWRPLCARNGITELPGQCKSWKQACVSATALPWRELAKRREPTNFMGRLVRFLKPSTSIRVIVTGCKGSGKSSMIRKLKLGECDPSLRETEPRRESLLFRHTFFLLCEYPLRCVTKSGPNIDCDVLCVVVDSSNLLAEVEPLKKAVSWTMERRDVFPCSLLIMANKQDIAHAAYVAKVVDQLGLHAARINWYIQATCVLSGDGLYESLDWIGYALKAF